LQQREVCRGSPERLLVAMRVHQDLCFDGSRELFAVEMLG
jgi:hypothetical protein